MKILIMGLSGSGKSTLAKKLVEILPLSIWLNADELRELYQDWDFSREGRMRQAKRMLLLSESAHHPYIFADFIAALPEQRDLFKPDIIVWMNTIQSCKYENTNAAFVPPTKWDVCFNSFEEVNVHDVLTAINSATSNFGGWADETMSSVAWRMERDGHFWGFMRPVIDWIFSPWTTGHCQKAYESEITGLPK